MAATRAYKIQTKEVVGATVVAEDHITVQLDIPPLLPKEQTGQLLAAQLHERKFKDEGGRLVRRRDGVTVTVDPDEGTMTVSAEGETKMPPGNPSPCSCRARARLHEAQNTHNELQRGVTRRLEGALGRLGCEMEGIVQRVTVAALKQKAGHLGQIKQIVEDAKNGSLTIVVAV